MKPILKSLFIYFSLLSTSYAGIALSSVVVDFLPGEGKHQDITVFNRGEETAYVVTEVKEVINPGDENETRKEVNKADKERLVVSPQKLVIPAGGRKNIRFVSLHKSLNEDKIYRVSVKPVIGELEAEQSMLKVLVGYGALVTVRPQKMKFDLKAERTGNKVTFTNNGNTQILVRSGKQCREEKCTDIPGRRLYAGNSWTAELPHNSPVEFTYRQGKQTLTLKK